MTAAYIYIVPINCPTPIILGILLATFTNFRGHLPRDTRDTLTMSGQDVTEKAAFYREQAARERAELAAVTLPMVRARHEAAIQRWDRLAARADLGAAGRNKAFAAELAGDPETALLDISSKPSPTWTREQVNELVARVNTGETARQVARATGRTPGSVEQKLRSIDR